MAEDSRWWAYVRSVTGDAKQSDIAHAIRVDQGTVSRWKAGKEPSCEHALRFARAYARPWGEALVAGGYAAGEDVGTDAALPQDISSVPDVMLLTEVAHRMSLRSRSDRR